MEIILKGILGFSLFTAAAAFFRYAVREYRNRRNYNDPFMVVVTSISVVCLGATLSVLGLAAWGLLR